MSNVPMLLSLAVITAQSHAQGQTLTANIQGNHHDSPVFYELFDESHYPDAENLKSLHAGRLSLPNFSEVDVSDFDWLPGDVDDYSWWIQVEELRFLLPFIASERPNDRALAFQWIDAWCASDRINPHVNVARWGEPMSVAYRGMVLVYALKTVERQHRLDSELTEALREAIRRHQAFLADARHFDADSNHGLVESVGLLELTRVFPDSSLERLGLERLHQIVASSVSEEGTHMEHAPGYHFAFLNLLDRYVEYLGGLSYLDGDRVAELQRYRARMMKAAFYMYDHGGAVAQIGDTDSVVVADRYPRFYENKEKYHPEVFYDTEAGFAFYKGNHRRGDGRYVVFTVQNKRPRFVFHHHDDALSVYYVDDGETILGDQGKYEYTWTEERKYFVSPAAHNTVFPVEYLRTSKPQYQFFLVDTSVVEVGSLGTRFTGRIRHTTALVERAVTMPKNGGLTVIDAITWEAAPGESASVDAPYTALLWNIGRDVASITAVDVDAEDEYEWFLTCRSGRQFRLRVRIDSGRETAGCLVKMFRGNHHPMVGWYSPALFKKRPSPTVCFMVRPRGTVHVTTRVTRITRKIPFALRILLRGY